MKATIVYADHEGELATSRFRCFTPAKGLSKAGHEIRLIHISKAMSYGYQGMDAVMVERTLTPEIVEHIRQWPVKLVFTFDDAYSKLPPYSHVLMYWRQRGKIKDFYEVLGMTDLNITPSQNLCDLYSRPNRAPFKMVPNFLLDERWSQEFDPPDWASDRIVLGWGGSSNHRESWVQSRIADGLRKLREVYDFDLRVYGHESLFAPLRRRGIKHELCDWTPWMEWPREMSGFDVVLAPSAMEYDKYRSYLRIDEAGAAGKPFVASNHGAYEGGFGGGFIVDNTRDSWYEALSMMIESEATRISLGAMGRLWADQHFISKNVHVYEEVLFG